MSTAIPLLAPWDFMTCIRVNVDFLVHEGECTASESDAVSIVDLAGSRAHVNTVMEKKTEAKSNKVPSIKRRHCLAPMRACEQKYTTIFVQLNQQNAPLLNLLTYLLTYLLTHSKEQSPS